MIKLMFLITISVLMYCSPYQMYYKYELQNQDIKNLKSFIITPIDMIQMRPKGTDLIKINELEELIKKYLTRNGYDVISNKLLVDNWQNEIKNIDGFFDPSTGELDAQKISVCLMKAIAKTKDEVKIDGVVFVQLIERPAKLIGDRVYWDGCSRKLLDEYGNEVVNIIWQGEMNALSLYVQIFNNNHQLVFESIGPIEFPYELKENNGSKEFNWKKDLQFKREEIDEGISIAFHPIIPYLNYPEKPNYYEK